MKKHPIIVACSIVLVLFLFWYYRAHPLTPRLEIRGNKFFVELAVTPQEQQRGLGYRDSLPADAGMLFVYQNKDRYGFWMKGMRFPIDIIWIMDQTIVDISKNVPVATTGALPTYTPKDPVNKVLEVQAGTADRFGVQIGDTIQILK